MDDVPTTVLPSRDALLTALAKVNDPEIRRPITDLGMVKSVDDRRRRPGARSAIYLTVAGCPMQDTLTRDVTAAVAAVARRRRGRRDARRDDRRAAQRAARPSCAAARPSKEIPFAKPGSLTRVYAVASGKGGVGKSSVTVNLAAAMAAAGLPVGVVDADIYGFSVPRMLGVTGGRPRSSDMILPPVAHGVKVISIGMFVPGNQPVVWRGPMLHRALQQFLGRRLLGRPRRAAARPAARHRRHRDLGGPAAPDRRDPRRHHPAAGRGRGRRAGRRDRPADPPADRRRRREHVLAGAARTARAHGDLRRPAAARAWPTR